MLAEFVSLARETGSIIEYPRCIELAGFMLRSDLAMCSDLVAFKRRLSNVGGKVATTGEPIEFEVWYRARDVARLTTARPVFIEGDRRGFVMPTRFIDIAKHAPERTSLEAIGETLGLEKLSPPAGYAKSRMDLWKTQRLESFREYGVRDAEITVRYWLRIGQFSREVLDVPEVPVSAGALAVAVCRRTFEEQGLDYAMLFDVEQVASVDWNEATGRKRTRRRWEVGGERAFHEHFAIKCFHGGRNECFYSGPSDAGHWYDFDLVGAYTTGLVALRSIDYTASFETKELDQFSYDVLGMAWVDFNYAEPVRFPVLPVHSEKRGLIFPLRGTSYCTAPEIAMARRQGCVIQVRRGVVWPWRSADGVRLFERFVRLIRELRKRFEDVDPLFEEYAKLLGNSVYGKTAQSLSGANAFDMSIMGSKRISPSLLTNAPIAAFTTGLIRAVIGELLHGIPAHRAVLSVTTDGFLTNARPDEIDTSGPLCQLYLDLCRRVEA
jgi:hypothetical protein